MIATIVGDLAGFALVAVFAFLLGVLYGRSKP